MFRLLVILILIPQIAFAHNKEGKKYIVGVEKYGKAPLYYLNEKGELCGMYREIFDKFAEDTGIEIDYKPLDINNLFKEYFDNKIDFKLPDNPTWRAADKRKFNTIYSKPLHVAIEAIFVRPSDYSKTIDDISSLGITNDVPIWSVQHYISINKFTVVKEDECDSLAKQVIEGKIDAMLCNYFVVSHLLETKYGKGELRFNMNMPYVDDYYYISTIKHREVIEEFDQWFEKNKPWVEDLHKKYKIRLY